MNDAELYEWLDTLRRKDDERLALIATANLLRAQGYTLRSIANVLNVSHEWVRQHLLSTVVDTERTL